MDTGIIEECYIRCQTPPLAALYRTSQHLLGRVFMLGRIDLRGQSSHIPLGAAAAGPHLKRTNLPPPDLPGVFFSISHDILECCELPFSSLTRNVYSSNLKVLRDLLEAFRMPKFNLYSTYIHSSEVCIVIIEIGEGKSKRKVQKDSAADHISHLREPRGRSLESSRGSGAPRNIRAVIMQRLGRLEVLGTVQYRPT